MASFFKKTLLLLRKLFLVVAVYVSVVSLLFYFINKDKPKISYDPIQKNRENIYKVLSDKKLASTKEGKISLAIYRIVVCGTLGEACTDNPDDGEKNYKTSILGMMSNMIVLPYINPPASGAYWVYSGLQNSGFIPKTYAAEGIGFAAVKPFMNLWKVFRDITYLILVLIMISIGFMIMFRMKINPQTVISVENSLPRIVIALLLITFSFAIAGFLIDIMYFMIGIAIYIMSNNGSFYNPADFQQKLISGDLGSLGEFMIPNKGGIPILSSFDFLFRLGNELLKIMPLFVNILIRGIVGLILGGWLFFQLSNISTLGKVTEIFDNIDAFTFSLGKIPSGALNIVLGFIIIILALAFGFFLAPQLVIGLLVLLTIIFVLFRIFFLLFTTYIRIVLMIIFAPIFIVFEAIPGKNAFSYWLKNLMGDLLTFPVVVILLIAGYIIANTTNNPVYTFWAPPFLGSLSANTFSMFIGMGIILMIPDLVKMVREMLGIKPMPINLGLSTFFGGVGAAWTGAQTGFGTFTSLTQMPIIGGKIMGSKIYETLANKGLMPPQQGELMAKKLAQLKKEGQF